MTSFDDKMIYPSGSIPTFTTDFFVDYLHLDSKAFDSLVRDGFVADYSDHDHYQCGDCGGNINRDFDLPRKVGSFRCTRKGCRKRFSVWTGTFLDNSNLDLVQILHLAYLWLQGTGRDAICNILGLAPSTVTRWIGRFRFLACIDLHSCTEDYQFDKIGGVDENQNSIIVEVDESCFGKVKYHRGHPVEQSWVVGGVERTPQRRLFAAIVQRRNVETLSRIISTFVEPGSTIYTDCWRGYSNDELASLGFVHDTVNHTEHFVDPVTGVHTNTIEGSWNGMKLKIPPRQRAREFLGPNLNLFIWRRLNVNRLWSRFLKVLSKPEEMTLSRMKALLLISWKINWEKLI